MAEQTLSTRVYGKTSTPISFQSAYTVFSAGIPQVLLPAWTDCYDFANRVELLGIGRWGNKKAKPRWQEDELSGAILATLFGPESVEIQKTAGEVASRHPEWEGRQKAAEEILKHFPNAA